MLLGGKGGGELDARIIFFHLKSIFYFIRLRGLIWRQNSKEFFFEGRNREWEARRRRIFFLLLPFIYLWTYWTRRSLLGSVTQLVTVNLWADRRRYFHRSLNGSKVTVYSSSVTYFHGNFNCPPSDWWWWSYVLILIIDFQWNADYSI